MTITVIGTGFVGVVASAVFAKFGNTVYGLDIDEKKIKKLSQGKMPFFEPGLKELVLAGVKKGNLKYTTSYKTAISRSDVIFISVGTPSASDGQADIKYVLASAKSLAPHLKPQAIVVLKSTVPPSTNQAVEKEIKKHTKTHFHIASMPEFLKEGTAVDDFLNPDRVVIGANSSSVVKKLETLHKPLGGEIVVVKPESAQMSKYAANAYLAQRITFINQIANLCEKNGADVQEVIQAMGFDQRIGGHYWYPGLGYGGSCFPKDVKEVAAYARAEGESDSLFIKIDQLNDARIPKILNKLDKKVSGFKDKTVAILGLSFKPNTSDTREAPAAKIIPLLLEKKVTIRAYDPQALEEAKHLYKEIYFAKNTQDALKGVDILMLLIEWDEFTSLDLKKVKQLMKGNIFIDTRNQYDPKTVAKAGLKYIGIGR